MLVNSRLLGNYKDIDVRFIDEMFKEDTLMIENESNCRFKVSDSLENDEYVIGAFKDNTLVGFATLGGADVLIGKDGDNYHMRDGLLFSDWYVSEAYRKNGIGTFILNSVMDLCEKRSINLFVEPWEVNKARLLVGKGFKKIKETNIWFKDYRRVTWSK